LENKTATQVRKKMRLPLASSDKGEQNGRRENGPQMAAKGTHSTAYANIPVASPGLASREAKHLLLSLG
jgi:hypothetical protein